MCLLLKDGLPLFPCGTIEKKIKGCLVESNTFKTFFNDIHCHLGKHSLSPKPEVCQMAQILRSSHWGIQKEIWSGYANIDIKTTTMHPFTNALQLKQ